MIFRSAIRSLKDDSVHAFFYCLTFVLSAMLFLLFFTLAMSDAGGITIFQSGNDMGTLVTLLMGIICIVVIFFANDFYVKKKSQYMAIHLVSGGNYAQLVKYLLIQTTIIVTVGIAAGLLLAVILIPVLEAILRSVMDEAPHLTIHSQVIGTTAFALVFVIVYTTYLNLAYSYRNSIKSLTSGDGKLFEVTLNFTSGKKMNPKIMKIFAAVMYLLPLILFWIVDMDNIFFVAIAGMAGFWLSINHLVMPYIEEMIRQKKTDDPISVAYLGFLRFDLNKMKKSIILMIISDMIFFTIFASKTEEAVAVMLSLISFIVINLLLALSIMFNYSSIISDRPRQYLALARIGYTRKKMEAILRKETAALYGFITVATLIYILDISLMLVARKIFSFAFIIQLAAAYIIPMIVCALVSLKYYQNTLRGMKEKR